MDPTVPRIEDQAEGWRTSRRRGLAVLLLMLALIWVATAAALVESRAAALEAAHAWAEAQAETAAQAILRAFEAVGSLHDLVRVRQTLLRAEDGPGVAAIESLLK